MANFFEKRDPWGHGLALWVLVSLAFLTPIMFSALGDLDLENDVRAWLPQDDPQARAFAWYQEHFPTRERILVAWEGSTLNDPRVARFAERLLGRTDSDGVRRGGAPQVAAVITPQDVIERIVQNGVSAKEAIERLEGVLIGTGRLKVRLTSGGRETRDRTIRRLRERARDQLGLDIEVLDPVTPWYEQMDDGGITFVAEDVEEQPASDEAAGPDFTDLASIPPHDLQIAWRGIRPDGPHVREFCELARGLRGFATAEEPDGRRLIEDCFFAGGSPIAMAVVLSEAGEADLRSSVAAVRAAAADAGVPPERLHLGGRPAAATQLNDAVKRAAWNKDAPAWMIPRRSVMLLSGIVGIALAFLFLRNIRLGLIVVGVSYYAACLGVSVIPLSGHSMNMVLIVMPTLLMVLTLSGAIHVANYWKHSLREDPHGAIVRATRMARQPCVMASLTTAIGLLSLLSSNLTPVRQFGAYSAIGCLIALVLVLYGLPALLQVGRLNATAIPKATTRNWRLLGLYIGRYPWFVLAAGGVLLAVAAAGLSRFQTETKVIRYFPDDSPVVRDYEYLEENLSGITPVDVIVRFNADSQRKIKFLERLEVIRGIEQTLREHSEISGTTSLATFLPRRSAPAEGASRLEQITYNRRSSEVERRIKEGTEAGATSFLVVAGPADDASSSAAEFHEPGDELWRITAQAAIMSDVDYGVLMDDLNERVQSVTRYHAGSSHLVTGTVPLFLRTQQAVLESLIWSFGLAMLVIGGVMVWVLRSPLAAALSMIPNVFPILVVFGMISWFGQRVDVGAMITASVALGIAVDGTLHLLTWFRDGIRRGLPRHRAMMLSLSHCGPAMWQTSVAVGLGLLMMAPAELILISRFGWLMSALIGVALVADVILLPALLAGPLGAVLERCLPVDEEPVAESPSAAEIPLPHIPFYSTTEATARSAG